MFGTSRLDPSAVRVSGISGAIDSSAGFDIDESGVDLLRAALVVSSILVGSPGICLDPTCGWYAWFRGYGWLRSLCMCECLLNVDKYFHCNDDVVVQPWG